MTYKRGPINIQTWAERGEGAEICGGEGVRCVGGEREVACKRERDGQRECVCRCDKKGNRVQNKVTVRHISCVETSYYHFG